LESHAVQRRADRELIAAFLQIVGDRLLSYELLFARLHVEGQRLAREIELFLRLLELHQRRLHVVLCRFEIGLIAQSLGEHALIAVERALRGLMPQREQIDLLLRAQLRLARDDSLAVEIRAGRAQLRSRLVQRALQFLAVDRREHVASLRLRARFRAQRDDALAGAEERRMQGRDDAALYGEV